MAGNQLAKYVWLVDIIRQYKHLTYKQISEKWKNSDLGSGEPLSLRTFHNFRAGIAESLGIDIELDKEKRGYYYHIAESSLQDAKSVRSWVMDSYSVLNQVLADKKLENRIQFEKIPSGNTWLSSFMQAMRENKVVKITYKKFSDDAGNTFEVEPYFLKVANRRWYVIVRALHYVEKNRENNTHDDEIRVYALDRIVNVEITDKTFKIDKDFNADEFYDGCVGVTHSNEEKQHVVIRAYGKARNYMETLPFHESQRLVSSDEDTTLFEMDVKITNDFLQLVMQQGDMIEVLEPESVRVEMRKLAEKLMEYYER
ncbi:MAG: WYL domain-containing protein [Paludibacteraceae bacterium]|nr:WYL domain-containing protein [Paludibacteraceae bacterium]